MKKILMVFLLTFSSVALGQTSQLSQLDGEWYSNQWKYGYTLTNGVGVATSTNSANYKVGDKIIFLKQTSDKTFEGTQVYTDGKFYKITVQQQSNDILFFKGEKNVSWTMVKKTHVNTQSVTGEPSTTPSLDTSLSSVSPALTDQNKLPPCQGTSTKSWTKCFGILTVANGNKYVGEFKDGKCHGQGTLTHPNGTKYFGEFKDDKLHGQGTLIFANSDKYVGEFKDGNRHGQGTYTFANGGQITGEYKDDYLSGRGTETFANGNKYIGEYKDDKKNGQGTFTFANGEKYVGEFKDDKRNGLGTFTFASGEKYVGEFKNGKRNGQGTFTFASGNKYVGEFKDDQPNGQGTRTSSTGTVLQKGSWSDGIFVAVVASTSTDKTIEPNSLVQRATQGDAEAQYHYGMKFINGTGDEVKPRIAIEWLMKAQAQGHEGAKKQIASMFDFGVQMMDLSPSIQVHDAGLVQNALFTPNKVPTHTNELGIVQQFINLRPQYKQVSFFEDALKIKPIQISNSEGNGKQLTYDVKGCEFSVNTDENKNVVCVSRSNWTLIPPQTDQRSHGKLDSHSRPT